MWWKNAISIVFIFPYFFVPLQFASTNQHLPLIISTWNSSDFQSAAQKAFDTLTSISPFGPKGSGSFRRLNALVEGLSECERRQCDTTVGAGGSPDENGETTLDSLLMDGQGHRSAAVAALRRVKSAARVAWAVMNYTEHSLLVGEKATQFALAMGFKEESLETAKSREMHQDWLKGKCQPNFWKVEFATDNVYPRPNTSCGPYHPEWPPSTTSEKPTFMSILNTIFYEVVMPTSKLGPEQNPIFGEWNHDTIGMVIVDERRNMAAGTSSNGAKNKIPGRVGDSPIVGAGAYVDNEVGGAAATGDGDVMMRFLPSYLSVELMRQGKSPIDATKEAVRRIKRFYPTFFGAVIAATVDGNFGAACSGMKNFGYSVVDWREKVHVELVDCEA